MGLYIPWCSPGFSHLQYWFLGFTQVVAAHQCFLPLHWWVIFRCMDRAHFIDLPPVNGKLSHFYFLSIVRKAAINVHVHDFVWTHVSVCPGHTPKSRAFPRPHTSPRVAGAAAVGAQWSLRSTSAWGLVIFVCVCWPLIYLLQRNYSRLWPICNWRDCFCRYWVLRILCTLRIQNFYQTCDLQVFSSTSRTLFLFS